MIYYYVHPIQCDIIEKRRYSISYKNKNRKKMRAIDILQVIT